VYESKAELDETPLLTVVLGLTIVVIVDELCGMTTVTDGFATGARVVRVDEPNGTSTVYDKTPRLLELTEVLLDGVGRMITT